MTNWKDFIVSDPQILIGKPIIKGTRLSVDFILELLSQGWTEEQLLTNYKALHNNSNPDCLNHCIYQNFNH
ncbi:MAG TPA: antitoxin [Spirochaetia bacterium]|nr:antitoxin [Spirochaetia bacterium]